MINTSSDRNAGRLTLILASVVFFVIITVLWALLTFFPSFTGGITAKKSALTDLGNTIVVFSFVALALQSSLGVFVSNFRTTERDRKIRFIEIIKEDIGEIKAQIKSSRDATLDEASSGESTSSGEATASSSPQNKPRNPLTPEELAAKRKELKSFRKQLEEAKNDLEEYRSITKNIISILSLFAGIVISLAGVRILQSFADISLVGKQLSLFNTIDILLTGGLLAGGSAGVHRLTKVYEQVTDVSKQVKQENK